MSRTPLPLRDRLRAAAPSAMRPLLHALLDLALALAAMLLLSLVFMAGWATWLTLAEGGAPPHLAARLQQPGVVAQIAMSVLVTGAPALALFLWRRPADAGERAHSLRQAARPSTWAWAMATGIGVFALASGAVALVERLGVKATPSNLALVEAALRTQPALLVLFAVVLAPLYEELLFRRVVFGRLWAAGRPGLGMLLSGAAFALLHEPPGLGGQPPAAFALLWTAYGLMGVAFAWVYRRTGTLWAAIGAHALHNALGCAALLLGTPG